jgi:hypothetical protein
MAIMHRLRDEIIENGVVNQSSGWDKEYCFSR